jgi:hypothetical protein|uniref:Uncharacterized protein n=2 Tax=Picea TaxID=3328 RepID=A0A101M3K3_PICGL|nr:hypothetical protein ABT39_MTgene208 [Picea glauca]QHR90085.1 hypothetical protein Q903MT_gene4108 [Picea sitchensis]
MNQLHQLLMLDLLYMDIYLGEALAIKLAIDHIRRDATGNEYEMGNGIGSLLRNLGRSLCFF